MLKGGHNIIKTNLDQRIDDKCILNKDFGTYTSNTGETSY